MPPSQAESWAASLAERASAAPDATSPAPAEEDLLLQGSRPEAESASLAVTAVARQRRTPAPGPRVMSLPAPSASPRFFGLPGLQDPGSVFCRRSSTLKFTAPIHICGSLNEIARPLRLSDVPTGCRPLKLRLLAAMLPGSPLRVLMLHWQVTYFTSVNLTQL